MELWGHTNHPYPTDTLDDELWLSSIELANALNMVGIRLTHEWLDTTANGPSSPDYDWWDNLGNALAPHGLKIHIGLEIDVNDHAGWETLAGDATGWTNYTEDTSGPPPYGSGNALITQMATIYIEGLRRVRAIYSSYGYDPDEYVHAHGPNEPAPSDWSGDTAGDGVTYTFHGFLNVLMPLIRAAYPDMHLGSPVINGYYSGATPAAEQTAHVNKIATIAEGWTTHYDCYNVFTTNIYCNIEGFGNGCEYFRRVAAAKAEAVYAAMKAGFPNKEYAIGEFGVSLKRGGLRTAGRANIKNQYYEQGNLLRAFMDALQNQPWVHTILYSLTKHDTDADEVYGLIAGGTPSPVDSLTAGQWRASAKRVLEATGSTRTTGYSGGANWGLNTAGSTSSSATP